MAKIADYEAILASPERQRQIVGDELGEIVDRYGDDRRTRIIPYDGDVTDEDLIAEEDVVVTITRGGYAKRTKTDLYRAQRRGGKGVRGAQLRTDDIVDHFFVTTTHRWILFFTNKGRVYRAKAYELPDTARDARGQHVANLLAFQPDERIAEVLAMPDYSVAPYLVIATRTGLVKKSLLTDFDSPRSGGIIAINLRDDDEVIAARLVSPEDDLLLVSRKAQAIRFHATDEALRPMGRATSGVIGMRFTDGDELLDMHVLRNGADVHGGHRRRVRQADPGRPVPGAGPRRPRRAHGPDHRLARRAGRRADGAPGGRGVRDHFLGRRHPHLGRGGQAVRPADHGRAADEPGPRGQRGGHRAQRRIAGRGGSRGGNGLEIDAETDAELPETDTDSPRVRRRPSRVAKVTVR